MKKKRAGTKYIDYNSTYMKFKYMSMWLTIEKIKEMVSKFQDFDAVNWGYGNGTSNTFRPFKIQGM